jgi:hypothetical protein
VFHVELIKLNDRLSRPDHTLPASIGIQRIQWPFDVGNRIFERVRRRVVHAAGPHPPQLVYLLESHATRARKADATRRTRVIAGALQFGRP